ncbi:MAG: MFS transporter [Verrucomicrobia bacterium]|jgi:MFS family permease|nr:MFS transporter [Verrucomicrobiota bacterium]
MQEPPVTEAKIPAVKRWRVGTLVYTRATLFNVLFWMLWGDFCLMIMESLLPNVVPLQLRWAGAGDSLVGFLSQGLPALIGMMLNPMVGLQSDRHRSPMGRRRPFLLWSAGPVVVSLLLLGAAGPMGGWIHGVLSPVLGTRLTVPGCTIVWIGIAAVVFVVFNTYVMQVYQFLFADVVPKEVMGKFVGLYRAVGACGSFAFNRWLLGWVETHTFHVYALVAVLYASAFGLLVWRVREGDYPPPPPGQSSAWAWLTGLLHTYFSECYRHKFYLNLYLIPFFFWLSIVPFNTFVIFFATHAGQPGYAQTLGLTLDQFGKIKAWTFFVQVPVFLLAGPLVDRWHPLRLEVAGLLLTALSFVACFVLIHDAASLQWCWILNQVCTAIVLGAYLALFPRLLPLDKYGQFFSANQIFGFTGVVLGPTLCGWMLETVRDYRLIFLWCAAANGLSFLACVTLFVQWRRLGGDGSYTPPRTDPAV